MSPIWWLIVAYYAVGTIGAFRALFRSFTNDLRRLDGEDFVMGLVIATLMGPIAGPFYPPWMLFRFATRDIAWSTMARVIGGESPDARRLRRLQAAAERKREIERLERELEIGDPA